MHITLVNSNFNPKNPNSPLPEGQSFEQTREAYQTVNGIMDRLDGLFGFMEEADNKDFDLDKTVDSVEIGQAQRVAGEDFTGNLSLKGEPQILSGQLSEDRVSLSRSEGMTRYEVIAPNKVYTVEIEAGDPEITLVEM